MLIREPEYWKARIASQMQMDLLSTGNISVSNRSALQMMPKEMQKATIQLTINMVHEQKQFEALIEQGVIAQIEEHEKFLLKTQQISTI